MKVTVIMWICLDCQLTCLLWIQSGSSRIQQDPVLSTVTTYLPFTLGSGCLCTSLQLSLSPILSPQTHKISE